MPRRPAVITRIETFNDGRRRDLLVRKYKAMARDPFVFFRGSAHLFWEDWAARGAGLDDAPLVWCCGDLHLENFGSYRADNRLVYFDVNDFDEGALAPATRDVSRLLTSLRLAGEVLSLDDDFIDRLERSYLDAYFGELTAGKARWVERATAGGIVGDLLRSTRALTRAKLLAKYAIVEEGKRRIRIRTDHTFALTARERQRVITCVDKFAATTPNPTFYRVLDVAGRIAGTGSLGLERYVVLVRGPGGRRRRRLLDLKQAPPSALTIHLPDATQRRQPRWTTDAERIVAVQYRMQVIAPALLAATMIGRKSFVIRELQPSEDKLSLSAWKHRGGRLLKVVATMGRLTAWAQLRSASTLGADRVDDLIAFGRRRDGGQDLVVFSREYARVVRSDWMDFCQRVPSAVADLA